MLALPSLKASVDPRGMALEPADEADLQANRVRHRSYEALLKASASAAEPEPGSGGQTKELHVRFLSSPRALVASNTYGRKTSGPEWDPRNQHPGTQRNMNIKWRSIVSYGDC